MKPCEHCGADISHRAPQARNCAKAENPRCHRERQNERKTRSREKNTVLSPRKGDLYDPVAQRWIPAAASESLPDDHHVEQCDGDLNAGLRRDDPAALWLDARHCWTAHAVTRRAIAHARAEDAQGIPLWIVGTLANIAEAEKSAQFPARDDRPGEDETLGKAEEKIGGATVTDLTERRAAPVWADREAA